MFDDSNNFNDKIADDIMLPPVSPSTGHFHIPRSSAESKVKHPDARSQRRTADVRANAIDISDLSYIVHCHLRWDFVWQRPQQIFSRIAERHPVLFIEDPRHEIGEARLEISSPQENIIRVVPVLPAELDEHDVDAESAIVLAMLEDALLNSQELKNRFKNPVQWFYSPMTASIFAGEFNAVSIVYDCMDELANFHFAPPDIRQREQKLLAMADVVFTGGHQLFKAKSADHENVHFFGCGVDVAHFGGALRAETPIPDDVACLPHPILGYFGVIDERIDYELIADLAHNFPDASVVMVGPRVKVDESCLPQAANIHWLGQRSYMELPAYVKSFDVCLMPFALNDATRYINPTKTLEYMAAGKPIVSTAVPDVVHNFTPIVEVAHSHDDFAHQVARLYRRPDSNRLQDGLARAQANTWEAIVNAMYQLSVQKILARTTEAAAATPDVARTTSLANALHAE